LFALFEFRLFFELKIIFNPNLFLLFNKKKLHFDILFSSEHINEEDSKVFELCSRKSREGNTVPVFFGSEDCPSQDIFNELKPFDLSSAQMCSALLSIHINGVAVILFLCSSKQYRKLLIFLSSN